IHRLLFVGVLAAPILFVGERARVWWIIGVLFIHDSLLHLGAPMWMSWMGDLVPENSLNRLWGLRQRSVTAANVAGAMIAAVVMGWFEGRGQVILGFSILAGAGVVAGVVDILLFWFIPEPPPEREEGEPLWRTILQPLVDRHYRPFVYFMLYWYFSLMLAAPFFTLYMIESLRLSAFYAQAITVCALIGIVISSRFWGLVCDTYGNRPALQIALLGKPFTILAFVLAPRIPAFTIPCLAISYLFDGMLNAGLVLAIQGIMFHASPRRNRTMYIATMSFLAVGLAGGIAPLISGKAIDALEGFSSKFWIYDFNIYHVVFVVSILLRLGALYFAARVPSRRLVPMRAVLGQICQWRVIQLFSALRRLEKSDSGWVRARAARRLGSLRNPLAISGLIEALEDTSKTVRRAAIAALGKIGNADAVEPLALALRDPSLGMQSPAARALGRIGGHEPLQVLLKNLSNLDKESLCWTIDYLGEKGDSVALLPLICLHGEASDSEVQDRIIRSLSKISNAVSPQEVMALFDSERRPGLRP
ncbi:MAG TPA: MFS transporter, partial [Sumerlaeia bacterium]|nr:MFS transporter [Sumerlaeia bacterium]